MGVLKHARLDDLNAMNNRSKTINCHVTDTTKRILPRSWRGSKHGKSAPSSPAAGSVNRSFWTPVSRNTWCNSNGNRVVLAPTSLLHLTEIERLALQKVALSRLQAIDLGPRINIPKEWTSQKSKKSRFLLKRRVVGSSTALDNLPDSFNINAKDPTLSGKGDGWVFGIPLAKCIANDAHLRRDQCPATDTGHQSDNWTTEPLRLSPKSPLRNRKSSSSSGGAISCDDSLSESECSRDKAGVRSSLVDALLLVPSSGRTPAIGLPTQDSILNIANSHQLQVPYIVTTCCQHLQIYGLRVLGIFRIGSSKKRTTQLREEFDTGRGVQLTEEHNPHDVAALLKEFFRDLPDPLLTRDLYSAFVATCKLKPLEKRLEAINLLIGLLPASNRDTLWALLTFLNLVTKHSTDSLDEHGKTLPGNKMDSHNLATLFGPNILHKAKGGAYQVESQERAEERVEVIEVVKEMIDNQTSIFELSADLHDETLRQLMSTNPEAVDQLLRSRTVNMGVEPDADSTNSVYDIDSGNCSPSAPRSPKDDVTNTSISSHHCPPSPVVGTLIEALQPPPAGPFAGRTLVEVLQAHAASALAGSSSGGRPSALVGAVLGGVDMSLAAVALGASSVCRTNVESHDPSESRDLSERSGRLHNQPETLIRITTESPERRASTTSDASLTGSPRVPGSVSVGRRSSGVPHGSIRSFEQHQQHKHHHRHHHDQQPGCRRAAAHHHHQQLQQQQQHQLVVPCKASSARSCSSSPPGSAGEQSSGAGSLGPSSASPSPEPPTGRRTTSGARPECCSSCSLSTHRPLGVMRAEQSDIASRGCLSPHWDRHQLPDELPEQETLV